MNELKALTTVELQRKRTYAMQQIDIHKRGDSALAEIRPDEAAELKHRCTQELESRGEPLREGAKAPVRKSTRDSREKLQTIKIDHAQQRGLRRLGGQPSIWSKQGKGR